MSTPALSGTIDGLFSGKVSELPSKRGTSAISKKAVIGRQKIDEFGLLKDEQADLENHGGLDKAIHHYPADHYAKWIAEGEILTGTIPAAFGENISTLGLTELTLCIGDKLRLGGAVVQISQGRQPCWKVSEYTQNKKMAYLFQKTSRTGWYYRVLDGGDVNRGDHATLIERTQPDWSVARVTSARLSRKVSQADAEVLACLPELAEDWRVAFARMASGDREEDTSKRLGGS